MKRRKFIQYALVSTPLTAGSALAGTRLFGAPGSVVENSNSIADPDARLRLPLSKTGLPEAFWQRIRSLTGMVSGILESRNEAAAFSASPSRYLDKHGVDASDSVLRDETVRLLTAVSAPDVQEAMRSKDYKATLKYLKASGTLSFDPSRLQMELAKALDKNAEEVKELISKSPTTLSGEDRESFLAYMEASGSAMSEDDLALTYRLITSEIDQSELAIVAVAIALVLVTAVAVGFVVVYTAIWVVGGPLEARISSTSLGKLAQADPMLVSNFDRVTRIAALTGDRSILEEGTRTLITSECSAIVGAMRDAKIIKVSDLGAQKIVEALSTYSYKAVGV